MTMVPEGWRPLKLRENPFLDANGPLYGRREDGALLIGLRVEQRHCNPAGICHGGMLMTLADMVLAIGSNHAADLRRFLPTVNLAGDFLAPAPVGSWLSGRAEVLRVTRNLVFSQALITADAVPVLRASGIMKLAREPEERFRIDRILD